MPPPPALTVLSSSEKDALSAALLVQVHAQAEQSAVLTARVAELEAKLNLPPKPPDNSSTPPSQGRKANGDGQAKPKARPTPARTGRCIPIRRGGATCWRSSAPTAMPP